MPPSFEPTVYRTANADLAALTDPELTVHYERFGRVEGRICSEVTSRDRFTALVPSRFKCLEIGPFNMPCLDPRQTDYVDVRDAGALRARATELGLDPSGVPEIRWVSADGSLGDVAETYDVVLSSHAIEHQVDLVRHLREVVSVLKPGGHYLCVIPDARFCFDHFLPLSSVADVLAAHAERRRRHSPKSVIEHWAMTGHNDPVRHWAGDHGKPSLALDQIRRALDSWADEHTLLDVHAWQFSPESFSSIVEALGALGLCDLEIVRVYPTVRNSIEFYAVLRVSRQ